MPDYSQGKIYTIRCYYDCNLIYVGSTAQKLTYRLGGHKSDSKKDIHKNMLLYKKVLESPNLWKDFFIELHEIFSCNNKSELNRREGEVIREIGTLNRNIAGRSGKEYYNDTIIEKKAYFEKNKEIIKQKLLLKDPLLKKKYQEIYRLENENILKEKAKLFGELHKENISIKKRIL